MAAKNIRDKPSPSMLCGLILLWAVTNLTGCQALLAKQETVGKSPLKPVRPSPASVAVEVFWARYPWGDERLNEDIWNHVDESQIPPGVRRDLAANGFRAGIAGGMAPVALAEVLHLEADPAATDKEFDADEQLANLLAEPSVKRRRRQLKAGQRMEIQASDKFPEMPLLVVRDGDLGGRTYRDAQAIYALELQPQPDRTASLQLTPELHHGPPQLGYEGGEDGIIRPVHAREREIFAHLRTEVTLAAGEMLVMTGSPDAAGRLGHCFHSAESSSGRQQKLVVIRLAQVPEGDAFAKVESVWWK